MQRLISFMSAALLLVLLSMTDLLAAPPSTQAYGIAFGSTTANSVKVIFNRGNGDSRIVVFKAGSVAPDDPTDGQDYATYTTNFSTSPASTGAGSIVVYAGTDRAVTVTGLTPGNQYTVEVYERNGTEYLIGGGAFNPRSFYTLPAVPASVGAGSHNVTHTSFRANWTDPASGNWDSFLITVATDNTYATAISTWYENTEVLGNDLVIEDIGAAPAIDILPNTTYFYRVRTNQDGRVSPWVNGPVAGVTTKPEPPTLAAASATICLNDTYVMTPTGPTPGNGTEEHKFKVYDAASGGTAVNAFPLLSINLTPAAPGVSTYWVATVSNKTGLESATRTQFVLTVNNGGPVADAGTDFSNCALTTYTYALTGNDPSPANGEWTQISGPGTAAFADATIYNTNVDLPNYGTYVFRWTITQDGCATTWDEVSVSLTEPPSTAVITPAPDVCGSLTATLTGNAPTSGTGIWTAVGLNGGTATFSPNANSAVASVTVSQADSYTFTWTITNGSCTPSAANDVVVFDATTTVAAAGSDDAVCGSLGYMLNGNAPTATETGTWTLISGPGTADFAGEQNMNNGSVTVSVEGTYVFQWTIESEFGICLDTWDSVTVVFSPQISDAVAAISGTILCGDLSVTMNATTPVVGVGEWTVVSGPSGWTFDDPSLENALFTATQYGSYTLRWTVSDPNNVCPDKTSDISFGFDALPTTANAGFDQDVCGLTATLAGNAPTVGTGTWSQDGGSGTSMFTNANLYNSSVTVSQTGSYSFEWLIESSCGTSADYVNITFWNDLTSPALSAGSDFSICGTGVIGTLAGTDEIVYGGSADGQWTKVSGSGTVTFEGGTNSGMYNAQISFNIADTYVMRWTVTNGPCVAVDEVTVTVSDPPSVSFGAIGPYCSTESPVTLTTGSPSGGTYSGAGVSGGSFDPSVATVGTWTLSYTVTDGGCSATATTVVTVTAPTAITWTNTYGPVCEDASSFSINHASPVGGTYSGPGVSGSTFDPATAGPGTHTITYTYGTGCVSIATKTIVVDAIPIITWTNSYGPVCISASAFSIGDASTSAGTGAYSGPGVTGTMFDPASAGAGTHIITYTATNGTCSSFTTKQIIVNPLPVVTWATSLGSHCASETTYTLTGGTPGGGTYSGAGVVGTNFNASSAGSGTHTLTYSYTDGNGCTNTATNTIIVNPLPTVIWTDNYGTVCEDGGDILLTDMSTFGATPYGGTYIPDDAGEIIGNTFKPSVAGVGTHSMTYTYTDGNGCTNTAVNSIVVVASPVATFSPVSPVCVNASAFSLTGYVTPAGGTFSGTGVSGSDFDPAVSGAGTFTITYTVTVGSCSDFETQIITVNPLPVITWTTSYGPACQNSGDILLTDNSTFGATPYGGTYTGDGAGEVVGNSFKPSVAGPGTHTVSYTYTDGNGCSNTATKTIVVNPLPTVTWTTSFSAVCTNSSSFALTGGSPGGGTYSGTGVSAGNFSPATAGAGTHTLTYTYSDGNGCTNTATNSIVVNALITAAAGSDANATPAGTFSYTLGGNVASPGTGTWTKISGPGNAAFTNANANNTNVTVDAYGAYTFRWTIVNGACTHFDEVVITFTSGSTDAVKLDIDVPGAIYSGSSFSLTVRSLDASDNPAPPASPVSFTVTVETGSSTFSGTVTGTITAPATQTVLTVTLNAPDPTVGEANVRLIAVDDANVLADGYSPYFNVLPSRQFAQAFGLSLSGQTTNSIDLAWSNNGGGDGVVIVGYENIARVPASLQLTGGTAYTASSTWESGTQLVAGRAYVVYQGNGSSMTVGGLDGHTTYAFKLFAYKGTAPLITYNGVDTLFWSNNRATSTLKGAFEAEDLPLVGDNILSSSYIAPNPARDYVNMTIDLTQAANVKIAFFTIDGQQVLLPVSGANYNAGRHSFNIPLKGMAAGVYSVVISAGNEVIIDNVVIMP
ncbi:MAG: T9SS type A sorting domain-containing protein [Candidatus Kapabacteria bacterium]|nr:T9SS type A sorting domain-containing protein [Candidatus Kapabacteria bacterium]